jgi:hypothetical protein
MKNFLLDTWPYLLLFAFGILLLTHHNDLAVGLQSRVGANSKGLFALGEDAQRILGCLAVFIAAVKISKRQRP